jgi:hypothetical protein
MKLFFPVFVMLFVLGCGEKKLTITRAGDFMFRRSYADIQFGIIDDHDVDSIMNSNPSLGGKVLYHEDSVLLSGLRKSGILDNSYNLVRSKFPESVPKQFRLTGKNGKQLQGNFAHRTSAEYSDQYDLSISGKKQKVITELAEHYGSLNRDISYLLLDLIPGGYPEIVVLNEYYIMNGDNSDIYIYEVTD